MLRDSESTDIVNLSDTTFPNNSIEGSINFPPTDDLAFIVVDEQLSIDNNSGQQILINDFRSDSDVIKNNSFPESYAFERLE